MNLEELMASTPPMQQHALIKGFQAGAASRDAEIAELVAALERMRVAGGSQEFHIAWELAKDVLDKVRKPSAQEEIRNE